MQYSQKLRGSLSDKFSPNSLYYVLCDGLKLYIKEATVQSKNQSIIVLPVPHNECAFSPNSDYLGVHIKKSHLILVYSVRDGGLIARIEDSAAGIVSFLWAKDSGQILSFSENNTKCSIYSLSKEISTYLKNPKLTNSKGCCFSKTGKFCALLERHDCKDYIGIYYTVDWKLVNSFQLQLFDTAEICWAPDDSYILAWDSCINYRIVSLCPMRGIVSKFQPYNYALGIKSVKYSNESQFIAIGSFDQKIRLLNTMTWKLIGELDCSLSSINPDKDKIKVYKEEDIIKSPNRMKLVQGTCYKIPTVKVIASDKGPPNQGISCIEFSPDDSLIACKNDNMPYSVFIWNISTLTLQTVISLNTHVKMFKWTKSADEDGQNRLCVVPGTDRLLFWKNQEIIECDFKFQQDVFNIQRVRWSQDGRKMLMTDKNGIVVFVEENVDFYERQ